MIIRRRTTVVRMIVIREILVRVERSGSTVRMMRMMKRVMTKKRNKMVMRTAVADAS